MKKQIKPSKIVKEPEEEFEGVELCEKCGTQKVMEDGKLICPDCDTEIDFFGEDDE